MVPPVNSGSGSPTPARHSRRRWFTPRVRRALALGIGGLFVLGCAVVLAAWLTVCMGDACPSVEHLDDYDPVQAAKVYAADGRLISDLGLERRTVVPLSEMSPAVLAAFISTEDKRFYSHHGVDWIRVLGAIKDMIVEREIAGGASTITMQLAGNIFSDAINRRDISLSRKIREAKVAIRIERLYSKDKILELYLNQINLGNRAYGVEAASQRYFGKSVRELNVAEAATLAAIPKAPERYNPRRHPSNSIQRRNLVISLMEDNGRITEAEAERWKAYPLTLSTQSDFSGDAQYFVEHVRQILQARFASLAAESAGVLRAIRRLIDRGLTVLYVVGNHDIALENFLTAWSGIHITPFLNVSSGDARIRIEHGHLYDPSFVQNPRLYEWLTRAAGPFLHFYPDVYRLWTNYENARQRARQLLRRGRGERSVYHEAAEMLLRRGFDAVVFGHTHQSEDVTLTSGRYLNCGTWVRGGSFVEIDHGQVALRRWGD